MLQDAVSLFKVRKAPLKTESCNRQVKEPLLDSLTLRLLGACLMQTVHIALCCPILFTSVMYTHVVLGFLSEVRVPCDRSNATLTQRGTTVFNPTYAIET